MKTTYFGEITGTYLESVKADGSEVFETDDGKCYDFKLEITEDGIKITDALDRYVPLNHSSALDLLSLLKGYKKLLKHFEEHEQVQDFLSDGEYYALPAGNS